MPSEICGGDVFLCCFFMFFFLLLIYFVFWLICPPFNYHKGESKGKRSVQIWGKNEKGKGEKLKGKNIYWRKKRKTQYFILLYTTFLNFVGICFILGKNTGGIC